MMSCANDNCDSFTGSGRQASSFIIHKAANIILLMILLLLRKLRRFGSLL